MYHDDRLVGPKKRLRERKQKLAALEAKKKQVLEEKSAAEKASVGPHRIENFDRQLAELDQQIAALPSFPSLRVGRFEQPDAKQHVFERGDASRKGAAVVPASISTLAEVSETYALPADAPEQQRRLALARWIVANDNPLTPRVLVNRLWHYHFGTGIVATPSDFGYMGEKPTHPELLDWLAKRLLDEGWKLKPLHKLIVMSQTYQQSSDFREEAARVDADSRLLWRFPPRRLAAEEIRDTILAARRAARRTARRPGFPLVRVLSRQRGHLHAARKFRPGNLSPERLSSKCPRVADRRAFRFRRTGLRFLGVAPNSTTTPSQALALMNHRFTMEMAESFARRLSEEAGSNNVSGQVDRAFELAFGRLPDAEEAAVAAALVEKHGLRAFCRAVMNSSELIYVN